MTEKYDAMAKVIKVLDPYTIVINRGMKDGVKTNDRYLVFALGEEMIDPDTGYSLGRLEVVRGRARATHVQEAITTLTSIETKPVTGKKRVVRPSTSNALASFVHREEVFEDPETIEVPLEARLGDLAKKV